MAACGSCSAENPDAARFCNGCGSPLTAIAPTAAREERRVVTVLFSDLAGFTSRSESLDPEDARALLVPYYDILETEVTGHGGVVERHIGDGIMALFGAPIAHEDDPERAIRAALRILERIPALGLDLHVRLGINTGEILFRSEGTGREDAVTGDAANTAARLQGLAPVDGVLTGEATWRATNRLFEYVEHSPSVVKGKTEPIRVFQPLSARARFGVDLDEGEGTPFVGREIDFTILKGLFAKSVASSAVQLVTVVGEPGIGKSRIVAELGRHVEDLPDLVTWRQGRCLPYGDGITFWALGEIVKAHAGILDSDPPEAAQSKLELTLPEGPERPWFHQRLLPLLGIEASSTAAHEELFTAWRRYIEYVAESHPTVLVFEDLHWADDAMLAFLEHLADRAEGVPLLVVGTSRPELYGRRPDFAAGVPNANRINLAPLSQEETGKLVSALLETTVTPDELKQPILDRADGNPLYAEEYVRLLKDRGILVRSTSGWTLTAGADIPFPDSVQALIAARLDTLTPDAKSMLADAAVIGKVFWSGAVAAMGVRDPSMVAETLRDLSRKELVRPARRSSMEGEAEYAFWHILARDVAYGQLSRSSRVAGHLAAARWIEGKAHDRVEDVADVLAYHFATALGLARATGDVDRARELEEPALRYLSLAGERALGLDSAAAASYLERALALTPAGHPGRAERLVRWGEALHHRGNHVEATTALEEGIELLQVRGDPHATARAMLVLVSILTARGDPKGIAVALAAHSLVEHLGPSPELVAALTQLAAIDAVRGDSARAIDRATRALELAEQLGIGRHARALGFLAMARTDLGDQDGLADFREAIGIAIGGGQGREVGVLHNNLAIAIWRFQGPGAALATFRDGASYAEARGLTESVDLLLGSSFDVMYEAGDHPAALELAADLGPRMEAQGNFFDLITVRATVTRIAAIRGTGVPNVAALEWLETHARRSDDPQMVQIGLGSVVLLHASTGDHAAAVALLEELDAYAGTRDNPNYSLVLPGMVRAAIAAGRPDLGKRLRGGSEPKGPYAIAQDLAAGAVLVEHGGDLARGAEAYADIAARHAALGVVTERAFALLGQGRCLVRLGRSADARLILREAGEIFRRLEATPSIAEIESLLAESTAPAG